MIFLLSNSIATQAIFVFISFLSFIFEVYAVAEKIVYGFGAFNDRGFTIFYDLFLHPHFLQFGL